MVLGKINQVKCPYKMLIAIDLTVCRFCGGAGSKLLATRCNPIARTAGYACLILRAQL